MSADKLALYGGTPVRTSPFPAWPVCDETDEAAVVEVLRSGKWCMSAAVDEFERAFADYHQAGHGVSLNSGTTALQVALSALEIGFGDEVIVPSYTFIATASAVAAVGGAPVFVDVDPETYTISPAAVEEAVTERTKAVIAVHVAGQPADLDTLSGLCARRGLALLEDACQAHAAAWKGRRVGAIGDLGCFSFQASKNLNCGEGGFITTDDDALADRAWSLHNCGRVRAGAWYDHPTLGSNYRLSALQAALLSCQLRRLDGQTAERTKNASLLSSLIDEVDGIDPVAIAAASQHTRFTCTSSAFVQRRSAE